MYLLVKFDPTNEEGDDALGPLFTIFRFCYDPLSSHGSYQFTLLRFCTKLEGKHPFFVRSH